MDCLYAKCKPIVLSSCLLVIFIGLVHPPLMYFELHFSFLTNSTLLLWRYPLYHWLCYGWAWKVRTKISCGFEVCSCSIITVLATEIVYKCVAGTYAWLVLNIVQLLSVRSCSMSDYLCYRIAKDPRFQRLACTHKGTYADDCIVDRVTQVGFCHLELLFFLVEVQVPLTFCCV